MLERIHSLASSCTLAPAIKALLCLSGIGFRCAFTFCAKMCDFSRLCSGRKVTSWLGLAPVAVVKCRLPQDGRHIEMRPQAAEDAPYGMCLDVRKGEAYSFEELPCVGGSTHQGACTAALGGGSCWRGASYPARRMSPQQPRAASSCSSSASRYRSGPQPRLHSATPPSTHSLHCLLLSISTKAMNAAAHTRLKAAGTPDSMCTGHANTYALRASLSRHVGTSMLGPCICTLSKDMRIGKDARMSHVAGRVRSGIC
jgi:hypothetical protein